MRRSLAQIKKDNEKWAGREARRAAVNAGVMKPPIMTLAETNKEVEDKMRNRAAGIKEIRNIMMNLRDEILVDSLGEMKERIVKKIKKAEDSLIEDFLVRFK